MTNHLLVTLVTWGIALPVTLTIIARKTLTKHHAAIDYWALDSLYWKTAHQQLLTQRPDEARLEQIAHRRSVMHRMMTHNDAFTTPLGDQL